MIAEFLVVFVRSYLTRSKVRREQQRRRTRDGEREGEGRERKRESEAEEAGVVQAGCSEG